MEQWAEIRRRVLVEGVSRRQILRETGMHWQTLTKILAHREPPGYRQERPRAKGRRLTQGFCQLKSHYLFDHRFCRPVRGLGLVERGRDCGDSFLTSQPRPPQFSSTTRR